jgi:hypothetical protein
MRDVSGGPTDRGQRVTAVETPPAPTGAGPGWAGLSRVEIGPATLPGTVDCDGEVWGDWPSAVRWAPSVTGAGRSDREVGQHGLVGHPGQRSMPMGPWRAQCRRHTGCDEGGGAFGDRVGTHCRHQRRASSRPDVVHCPCRARETGSDDGAVRLARDVRRQARSGSSRRFGGLGDAWDTPSCRSGSQGPSGPGCSSFNRVQGREPAGHWPFRGPHGRHASQETLVTGGGVS